MPVSVSTVTSANCTPPKILLRQGGIAHAAAKPGVVVAARSHRADAIGAQPRGGIAETHAAAWIVADQILPSRATRSSARGVERERRFAEERCRTRQAAVRAGGVIEAVVRLP